jgi:hypothetical protein
MTNDARTWCALVATLVIAGACAAPSIDQRPVDPPRPVKNAASASPAPMRAPASAASMTPAPPPPYPATVYGRLDSAAREHDFEQRLGRGWNVDLSWLGFPDVAKSSDLVYAGASNVDAPFSDDHRLDSGRQDVPSGFLRPAPRERNRRRG